MTPEDVAYWATWRATSGHPKGWRVTRQFFPGHPQARSVGCNLQEARGKSGRTRLFKTREAAQRVADALNKEQTNDA